MFGFFKKKTDPAVYAPVKGKCIDITEVNDEGFSSKIMGDGVAVIPEERRHQGSGGWQTDHDI